MVEDVCIKTSVSKAWHRPLKLQHAPLSGRSSCPQGEHLISEKQNGVNLKLSLRKLLKMCHLHLNVMLNFRS